jgi:hypothetical protein
MKINVDRKECNFGALKFSTEIFLMDETGKHIYSKHVC